MCITSKCVCSMSVGLDVFGPPGFTSSDRYLSPTIVPSKLKACLTLASFAAPRQTCRLHIHSKLGLNSTGLHA